MRLDARAIGPAALIMAGIVAQPSVTYSQGFAARLSLGAAATWEQSTVSGLDTRRTGLSVNGDAIISFPAIQLRAGYRQASLNARTAADDRELIEGRALLGLRLGRWAVLEAGPMARAYVTSGGGTERWLLWEGSARFETQLLGPAVKTYVAFSRVLGGDVTGLRRGQSGEAGLILQPGRSPVWTQLGYSIHQTDLADGLRVETLQGILFAAGVALR
ncbi:MAG TPA: hypothetical protein VNL18_02125 [Gemmatimonadales bacterium]|nr:hypothetical protein [Gemmatimonadales bacterium]